MGIAALVSVCLSNVPRCLIGSHTLQSDLFSNEKVFMCFQCCWFSCRAISHPELTLLWPVYFVETDSSIVQTTVQDLKDCGFDCWETSIGGPGVQQHSVLSVKDEVLEVLSSYWDRHVTRQVRPFVFLLSWCWVDHGKFHTELPEVLIIDFTDWLIVLNLTTRQLCV